MIFTIFQLATKLLATFALFALFLAAIGLFGLAAYMAEQKTKEIGIRKVLGANNSQIIKLLIWQFYQLSYASAHTILSRSCHEGPKFN